MSEQLESVKHAIELYLNKTAKKSGRGYRLPCPYHNGHDNNLYIGDGDKKLIIKCFSHQCDPRDIVESVGLSQADIYYERLGGTKLQHHKRIRNDLEIKRELEIELLILLFWINDSWRGMWPINEKSDPDRVELALTR